VLAYYASRDLIPLYGIYALLFADHGVSSGQVSTLFLIWSMTSFVFEVPSGAWADSFDRRRLLVLSAVVYAAGFASWIVVPTYVGFALGFVLWGLSSALMSGTFEALVYDELVTRGAQGAYPRLIGWAHATAMTAVLLASVLATLLYAADGYPLVGWVSVAIAGIHGLLAATLPVSERARRARPDPADPADPAPDTDQPTRHYLAMLASGLREATTSRDVRRVLLIAALLVGMTAYDEYFPLVAREHHVHTETIPLLVAITVVGQVVGTALAGRTAGMSAARLATVVATGAALISVGALAGAAPYAGFVAIGIGYGLLNNAMLVAQVRVQETITGPARATVTSVHGLATEVVALTVYGAFAAASAQVSVGVLMALLGLPMLVVAGYVARRLPARRVVDNSPVETGRG